MIWAAMVVVGVTSAAAGGAAGWKAHATVDDRRLQRLLARIHAEVVADH